jgi:hypothetical protein
MMGNLNSNLTVLNKGAYFLNQHIDTSKIKCFKQEKLNPYFLSDTSDLKYVRLNISHQISVSLLLI